MLGLFKPSRLEQKVRALEAEVDALKSSLLFYRREIADIRKKPMGSNAAAKIKKLRKLGVVLKCIAWAVGVPEKSVSNVVCGRTYANVRPYEGSLDAMLKNIKQEFPDSWDDTRCRYDGKLGRNL